jgi:DNA-directed RNA polymerase sigma subunit (sigma70/sigma32)
MGLEVNCGAMNQLRWSGGVLDQCSEAAREPARAQLAFDVEGALRILTAQEQELLRLRFGVGSRAHTTDELSDRLGLTPTWVRMIETRALHKLRTASLRAGRAAELHH